jgi:hemolysin III
MMRGAWRVGTLTVVWLSAALGIALHVVFGELPGWLTTALYLGMGWGSVFCYFELLRTIPVRTLFPIILGGVLYSVGALFHTFHWPVVWPGLVEGHELFHLLVVAASVTHYRFMLNVVAPWGRSDQAPWIDPVPDFALPALVPALEPVTTGRGEPRPPTIPHVRTWG